VRDGQRRGRRHEFAGIPGGDAGAADLIKTEHDDKQEKPTPRSIHGNPLVFRNSHSPTSKTSRQAKSQGEFQSRIFLPTFPENPG